MVLVTKKVNDLLLLTSEPRGICESLLVDISKEKVIRIKIIQQIPLSGLSDGRFVNAWSNAQHIYHQLGCSAQWLPVFFQLICNCSEEQ